MKRIIVQKRWVTILDRQRQNSLQMAEPISGEDEWYVFKNEQKYGPLQFSDLILYAKQKLLMEDNWVWRPGLDTWIAAGDVSGLFPAPYRSRKEPAQSKHVDDSGEERGERQPKPALEERAVNELKTFVLMFVYLWAVFGLLALHEAFILSEHQINYQSHGLAVINALVCAKVMLIAEDLRLGNRADDKPLIYPVLWKSILFAIAIISFHFIEHVLIAIWHGKTFAASISEFAALKLKGIMSMGVIATVSLLPFFALRELSRVIGKDKFRALFFNR